MLISGFVILSSLWIDYRSIHPCLLSYLKNLMKAFLVSIYYVYFVHLTIHEYFLNSLFVVLYATGELAMFLPYHDKPHIFTYSSNNACIY